MRELSPPEEQITIQSSRFLTRSDFGGPSVPNGFRTELTRIIEEMEDVPLAYLIDVMIYVGGDFLEITDATGVYSPRVSTAKKTATCTIQMNTKEVVAARQPEAMMRRTIHDALVQMIDRIAAKDKGVDADEEKAKIAFLAGGG